MNFPANNAKRAVESFIVASNSAGALYNTGGTAGNALVTGTNIVLANGQIGFFSTDGMNGPLTAMAVSPSATINTFAIYQGNANSANISAATATYPLSVIPYEKSEDFDTKSRITVTKQAYRAPSFSTWTIGNAASPIIPVKNTEYAITINYRGQVAEEMFGAEQAAATRVRFITPDYSTLATVAPLDHLVQNLVYQINLNSNAINISPRQRRNTPIIAFAIDTSGAVGLVINTITAGTVIPVVNASSGLKSITATAEQATALLAAVTAAGHAGASIVTVDLLTAGATAKAESILIMSLDRVIAFKDYIPQVKMRLSVAALGGFVLSNSPYSKQTTFADEGQGIGRTLNLQYKATQGQRKYNLQHTLDPIVNYPSPIDETAKYVTYTFNHSHGQQIDISNFSISPKKTIVLFPSTNTTAIGLFDTMVGNILTNTGNDPVFNLV